MVGGKTGTATTWLAWSLWALCVALIGCGLLLDALVPAFVAPPERAGAILSVSSAVLSLAIPTIGALVASRLPSNPVSWILCGMGLLYAVRRFAMAYADYALLAQPWLPFGEHAAWISTWLRFSALIPLGVLLVLLFPDGHLPSRRWRAAVWAVVCGAVMVGLGDAFRFGPLVTYYYVHNPFGIAGSIGGVLPTSLLFEGLTIGGGALLSASCLASIASLLHKVRRARRYQRQQLRWFAYAATPALVGSMAILLDWVVERFSLIFLNRTVLPLLRVAQGFGLENSKGTAGRIVELRADAVFELLSTFALLALPICAGVAILNHRVYGSDFTIKRTLLRLWILTSRNRTLRWPQILFAGVVIGFLPFVFIYLAIYAYVVFYPTFGSGDVREHLGEVTAFVSGWGAHAFFLATTILAAWRVARKAAEKVVLHGALVGLVAAVANQVITPLLDAPVTLEETLSYLALGVAGGWLGGIAGRTTLTSEVYQASRRISRANDPATVAAAIGEHLGGSGVHGVALWRATLEDDGSEYAASSESAARFALWGLWTAQKEEAWSTGIHLDVAAMAAWARLGDRQSAVLRAAELPADERAAWERRGIRSALLIRLIAPGDARVGLLMVAFRRMPRFSRGTIRAYLTVSAQAALVLENLRLVEEAGEAGRQAGILVERQRLAREIHDTLAQGFTGVITSLTAAQMAQSPVAADAVSVQHFEDAKRTARESLAEARRLVWALRPESLDRHSLSEALDRLAKKWSEETGIEARTVTTGRSRSLLPEVEIALLRTAQEALSNVRKHARGASRVNITLTYMDDRTVLDILDDGAGFDPARLKSSVGAQDEGGFGLRAMRERAEQLGGTLLIESAPGEGTTIVVELPVGANKAEAQAPEEDR